MPFTIRSSPTIANGVIYLGASLQFYALSSNSLPIITLNSPANHYNSTSSTIIFNGTISDDWGIKNVSLRLNGIINQTNYSKLNNFNYTFSLNISDGYYNWSYQVCDSSDICVNSSIINLTIDILGPSLSIFSPLPQVYSYNQSLSLNYSSTDINGVLSCNYSVINSTGGEVIIADTLLEVIEESVKILHSTYF